MNLARVLVDGEQVRVRGRRAVAPVPTAGAGGAASGGAGARARGRRSPSTRPTSPALETPPGVVVGLAQRILDSAFLAPGGSPVSTCAVRSVASARSCWPSSAPW